ncbi:MAG: class I SAM-dependent methyltransferase [Haloechinothrix sp.]
MGTTELPAPITALLDRTFGHPEGILGRFGGAIMARGNGATEEHVVNVAVLAATDTVLVVGPGPGVGLRAAAERARLTIGVDPSDDMLRACRQRCAGLGQRLRLRRGSAERTGADDASFDVVLTVNNVQIWDDRASGFAELCRVLRPGGRLLLSTHEKWLPVPRHDLAAEVGAAGFIDVQSWTWDPPGRMTARACQLRARKPSHGIEHA